MRKAPHRLGDIEDVVGELEPREGEAHEGLAQQDPLVEPVDREDQDGNLGDKLADVPPHRRQPLDHNVKAQVAPLRTSTPL